MSVGAVSFEKGQPGKDMKSVLLEKVAVAFSHSSFGLGLFYFLRVADLQT